MRLAVLVAVCGLVLAGCAGSSGSGGGTRTCVTKIKGPDGRSNTVVAEVTGAITEKDGLCEGDYASREEVVRAMFADGPSAPQEAAMKKSPAPVKEAAQSKPVAPKTSPAPVAKPRAQAFYGGVPQCSLKMVGGSGYACAYE